jgi:transcriptional regulator with XRE-family HTH domain
MKAADAIRTARLGAGLTQHALAARAGTSQATISAYESGRKQPSLATIERILAATGSRLEVVRERREPTAEQIARAGRVLDDVLQLAAALPTRRRAKLEFPRLPAPPRAA